MHILGPIHKRLLKQRRFRQLIVGAILLSLIIGALMVTVESRSPERSIVTVSDGLWWAVQTLTTVGYGDVTPVTDLGRALGVFMQIVGAVIFGATIAIISSSMSRGQEEFYWERMFERLDRIEGKVDELEKRTAYLIKDKAFTQDEKKE